jgi:hypothetical protein
MIIIAADQNRQAATLNLGYLGYSPSSEEAFLQAQRACREG